MKPYNILYSLVSLMLSLCTCLGAQAVELKPQGVSVEGIVPAGWSHQEAQGDLNKDGIPDLVVVATPDDVENTITRSDGYVYNFNQPILAIYFGTAQGQFHQWKAYDNDIPDDDSENCHNDVSLEITDRGVIRISIQLFCSAGSYGVSTDTYSYRYQNGDFFLIGMDKEEMQRNTGTITLVSENYLTWKRQMKESNAFDDSAPTEKWTKITRKTLEKLGAREL